MNYAKEPYLVLADRILDTRICARRGDVVRRFIGYDYGLARDDTMYFGGEHISVTVDGESSFTIRTSDLVALTEDQASAIEAAAAGEASTQIEGSTEGESAVGDSRDAPSEQSLWSARETLSQSMTGHKA
jgi:hypothetical protein